MANKKYYKKRMGGVGDRCFVTLASGRKKMVKNSLCGLPSGAKKRKRK